VFFGDLEGFNFAHAPVLRVLARLRAGWFELVVVGAIFGAGVFFDARWGGYLGWE